MSNLNWVDYIILGIFFLSIVAGFARGFVREVISLITLIAAFVIAIMFSNALATMFTSSSSVQNAITQAGVEASQPVSYLALGISFIVLFVGTILVGTILGYILNIAFQRGVLGIGNRIFGAAFGFVRGFLINLVLIFCVQLTPAGEEPFWHQSQLVVAYQPAVQWLGNIVSPSLANLKTKFDETIQKFGSQLQNITN